MHINDIAEFVEVAFEEMCKIFMLGNEITTAYRAVTIGSTCPLLYL
jgi:hypothetical protein